MRLVSPDHLASSNTRVGGETNSWNETEDWTVDFSHNLCHFFWGKWKSTAFDRFLFGCFGTLWKVFRNKWISSPDSCYGDTVMGKVTLISPRFSKTTSFCWWIFWFISPQIRDPKSMLVAFQASIRHPNLFAHLVCWKFWGHSPHRPWGSWGPTCPATTHCYSAQWWAILHFTDPSHPSPALREVPYC